MILITGATGLFGSRVVREGAARGADVRAMVHSAEHAGDLEHAGIATAVGDMDAPGTLAAPLEGVDTVFLVSPMDDRSPTARSR